MEKVQILPYDILYVDINISVNIVVDKGACALLPDEFNHYVCADITAEEIVCIMQHLIF